MTLTIPDKGWVPRIRRCLRGVWDNLPQSCARSDLFETLGEPALDPLSKYLDLVVQWNQRHDLTAARNSDELVDLFVADAALLAATTTQLEDWVDVGTGAGAPGLPLRLLLPRLTVSLVEPRTKRVAFLRSVTGALGATDVTVIRDRSHVITAGAHEVAVARATLPPQQWLEEGTRIATGAVWVLLAQADAPTLPGWQVDLDVEYVWPLTAVARRALRFVPQR